MSEHEHEFYYYLSVNEEGWRCCSCDFKPGEPPGFCPELDRDRLYTKVSGILHDIHDANIIYVSNGTAGDGLTSFIVERCKEEGRYDQESIALFILESSAPGHSRYWKPITDGILAGKDPRERCACGKLPCVYTGGKRFCSECHEKHWRSELEDERRNSRDWSKYPARQCRSLHECSICEASISYGSWYFDGGHGRRAHRTCVQP
jgi:hypothetical protein